MVVARTDGTVLGPVIPRGRGLPYSQLTVAEAAAAVRHETSLTAIAVSPDGRTVATTSGWVGTVKLWNSATGELQRTLAGSAEQTSFHGDPIQDCEFHPDGTIVAIAHRGVLELWETPTGKRLLASEQSDLLSPIGSCAFSPDGRLIAVGLSDGAVRVLDAETGATRRVFSGHQTGQRM